MSGRRSRRTPATLASSSPPARARPPRTPSSSRPTSRLTEALAGRTAACRALPAAGPAGDDVTVAFDAHGRGYVCATRSGHGSGLSAGNPDANRAVYVWRTDDGGRSFSAPVTLRARACTAITRGVAAGQDRPRTGTTSTSPGGPALAHGARASPAPPMAEQSFEPPRRILGEARTPSLVSAGPELAAGPDGLVCAVCDWTSPAGLLRGHDRPGRRRLLDRLRDAASPRRSIWGRNRRLSRCPAASCPTAARRSRSPPRAMLCTPRSPRTEPGAAHSDIVVVASRDRGRTWSKAVTATPGDGVIYFQPNLAVDDGGPGRDLRLRPRERPRGPGPARLPAREAPLPATAAGDHHRVRSPHPDGQRWQARSLVDRRLPGHHGRAPEPSTSCGTTPARESWISSRPPWRPNRTIALRQTRRRMWWSSISPTSRRASRTGARSLVDVSASFAVFELPVGSACGGGE